MKDGDIYRWHYNKETVDKKGGHTSTTYWCCSTIGIWNEKKSLLSDTYWNSGGDHTLSFNKKDIDSMLELRFIANINDLDSVRSKSEFNNYDDSDCINISHANMRSGGFYIKKSAKPSIEKKRNVLLSHIKHEEFEIKSHQNSLDRLKKDLKDLSVDSYMPYDKDVFIQSKDN